MQCITTILGQLFPDYIEAKETLESFSEYELSFLMNTEREFDIFEIEDTITFEIQWEILNTLLEFYVDNWEDLYNKHEADIMDYFYNYIFITHDKDRKCYFISEDTVLDVCKELLQELDIECPINEVDFRDVIAKLNMRFPPKFCKV